MVEAVRGFDGKDTWVRAGIMVKKEEKEYPFELVGVPSKNEEKEWQPVTMHLHVQRRHAGSSQCVPRAYRRSPYQSNCVVVMGEFTYQVRGKCTKSTASGEGDKEPSRGKGHQ